MTLFTEAIDIISYQLMEDKTKPDPRWNEFIEVFDENSKAIGFNLPDNAFLFKYEADGGWEDEKGIYYNAEGILSPDDSEHEDSLSDHDDQLVDQFEQLLREEEEGIVHKKIPDKTEEQATSPKENQKDKEQLDFKPLLEHYKSKERLREELPDRLFIYFKQRTNYYEEVTPEVENKNNTDEKIKAVKLIKTQVELRRKQLIASNDWLKQEGIFLDFSGDSEKSTYYDRYWYGVVRTSAQRYLDFIEKITNSKDFKILQIKTYYALKSKFYLKKGEEKIKKTIAELKAKVQPIGENQTASFLIDSLPDKFPCSYIYDLVEYVGGSIEDIESVIIEDDFSATITCRKETALLLTNIEGYNHDKGEYVEISFCEAKDPIYAEDKHKFYYITVDSEYKLHERQLHDTLALEPSKEEIAKHETKQEDKRNNVRFALGSIAALRRVLMFRGDTLNVVKVLPAIPK